MHQTIPGWPARPNSLRSTPVTRSLSSGTPQELMYSSSSVKAQDFLYPLPSTCTQSTPPIACIWPVLASSCLQINFATPSSNALQYRPQSVSHIESRKYAGIRIYRPSPCCTDSLDGSRCCGDSISCASSIECHVRVLVVSAGDLWIQNSGTPPNIVP